MTSPAFRLPLESIRDIARRWYGIDAGITEFPSYYGQNFHLVSDAGASHVLKVARPGETAGAVEMQHRAAEHLAAAGLGIGLPLARTNREGESVTLAGGRLFHLLSYIEGMSWSELGTACPDRLCGLGRLVGSLGNAFRGFKHSSMHRIFDWDLRLTPTLRPLLSSIGDPQRRAVVERIIHRYEHSVAGRFERCRVGVIHGDINNDNALVDADGRIVGLIDFELVGLAPVVAEPAVAVAYAMLGQEDPLDAAAHVLRGCHAAHPFLTDEIEIVMDLALARLAMSVTFAAHNRLIDPENRHLDVNSPAAWRVLEILDGTDPPRLTPDLA